MFWFQIFSVPLFKSLQEGPQEVSVMYVCCFLGSVLMTRGTSLKFLASFPPTLMRPVTKAWHFLMFIVGENSKPRSNGSNIVFLSNKTSQEVLFEQYHHQSQHKGGHRFAFMLRHKYIQALQFKFTLYKSLSLYTKAVEFWLVGGWVYIYISPSQEKRNALTTYQFQQDTPLHNNSELKIVSKIAPEERVMIVTTRKPGNPLKVFDNTSLIAVIQTQV